jgi:hypothetical protein
MSEDTKWLYVKFRTDSESHPLKDMELSEDLSDIRKTETDQPSDTESTEGSEEPGLRSIFRVLTEDFEISIRPFQNTVSFVMQNLPLFCRYLDNKTIKGYVKENGELIEDGEIQIFRLPFEHAQTIAHLIEDSTSLHAGIGSIPGLFFLGLVGAYDLFLSRLIRAIFLARPELLSASERNISLKDLMEIGTIEAAKERIIEKEVEQIIRESHSDQIEWLEKKLGMQLRKDLPIWPEFVELCERRNLLTHTGGVISTQYVTVCRKHNVNLDNTKLGQKLHITPKYYSRSVFVILEFGMKLIQVIWRKILPNEIKEADSVLNKFCYEMILRREYSEAITMLRFGLYEMKKHGEEADRRMMVVNLANAEKLNGNETEAERIISGEDWSATTDRFNICVAAVLGNVETVVSMMRNVVTSKSISIADFRVWPVFETMRSNPRFIEAFEREFGSLLVVKKKENLPKRDSQQESKEDALSSAETAEKTVH